MAPSMQRKANGDRELSGFEPGDSTTGLYVCAQGCAPLKCRFVSDILDAAAAALGTPADLVQRSAAARAAETGATVDEVLSSWAGGAPVAASTPPLVAEELIAEAPVVEESAATASAAVAVMEPPPIEAPAAEEHDLSAAEPEEPLEPVSLGQRVKTAVRVGAWTGAGLGLVAFFFASAFWADTTAVLPDEGPVVQADSQGVIIGIALVSILFGAIVAGFSRAAAGWSNPAMQLTGSKSATAWIGAVLGLILGVIAGVVLAGLGTEIEGSDGLIQLPVLPTLAVMLIGGAALGALSAIVPQLLGTPVAIDEGDEEELAEVRGRLGNAIGIPMVAMMLLVLLVIPFGYTLVQSSHLTSGGASIVAILTAGGILGFAALAGTKPQMKISFGDLVWAIIGLGTVLLVILAVLFYSGSEDHAEEGGTEEQAAVVQLF